MKTIKRLISVLLVFIMIISCIPVGYADSSFIFGIEKLNLATLVEKIVKTIEQKSTIGKTQNTSTNTGNTASETVINNTTSEPENTQSKTSSKKKNPFTQEIKIGDIVSLGKYEQDNRNNGKEKINWIVLEIEDNKAFIISEYALIARPFNKNKTDIIWNDSTIRKWLNDDFYNKAFSDEEKEIILDSEILTGAGNKTEDKVFLLSIDEANAYFKDDNSRMCASTDYAKISNINVSKNKNSNGEETSWWWLRSVGKEPYLSVTVKHDGSINSNGSSVNYTKGGIRPAMWIKIG